MISSHLCFGQVLPLRFQGDRARGFFIQCSTLRFRPYVQPFLYRLQFARFKQFQLIHLARLSFLSMGEFYFFARNVSFRTVPNDSERNVNAV